MVTYTAERKSELIQNAIETLKIKRCWEIRSTRKNVLGRFIQKSKPIEPNEIERVKHYMVRIPSVISSLTFFPRSLSLRAGNWAREILFEMCRSRDELWAVIFFRCFHSNWICAQDIQNAHIAHSRIFFVSSTLFRTFVRSMFRIFDNVEWGVKIEFSPE